MIKQLKVILLLCLLAFLSSCSKKTPEAFDEFISIPPLLKATFYHNTGSYWIYEEAYTGFIDCVFVQSATFDTVPILHPGNFTEISRKERFHLRIASSFYGSVVNIYSEVDCLAASFRPETPHHWVTYELRDARNNPVWANHLFTWPFTVGKLEPAYRFTGVSQAWQVDKIITNFTLNGQTYDTAYSTITDLDLTRQAQEVHRIYVPGIGEVRRNSVNHGIDWSLIRYASLP